jgi:hypothetical protein
VTPKKVQLQDLLPNGTDVIVHVNGGATNWHSLWQRCRRCAGVDLTPEKGRWSNPMTDVLDPGDPKP